MFTEEESGVACRNYFTLNALDLGMAVGACCNLAGNCIGSSSWFPFA